LIRVTAPREPEALISRYNMELARGLLYWAERLTVEIEDSPQDVFRYIKLCRLMHTITRLESGYRIELDGPLSLLRGTRRYGLKMAVFLPALALCRKWRMEAAIVKVSEHLTFSINDQSGLVSHFRCSIPGWRATSPAIFRKRSSAILTEWAARAPGALRAPMR
jgi:predicted nuclease of restriction endonuclease-like RecB superfamily